MGELGFFEKKFSNEVPNHLETNHEMFVLPTGLEIYVRNHFLGSKYDFEIFTRMRQFTGVATGKDAYDLTIDELGELHDEKSNRWYIIVDYG